MELAEPVAEALPRSEPLVEGEALRLPPRPPAPPPRAVSDWLGEGEPVADADAEALPGARVPLRATLVDAASEGEALPVRGGVTVEVGEAEPLAEARADAVDVALGAAQGVGVGAAPVGVTGGVALGE